MTKIFLSLSLDTSTDSFRFWARFGLFLPTRIFDLGTQRLDCWGSADACTFLQRWRSATQGLQRRNAEAVPCSLLLGEQCSGWCRNRQLLQAPETMLAIRLQMKRGSSSQRPQLECAGHSCTLCHTVGHREPELSADGWRMMQIVFGLCARQTISRP